MSTQPQPEEPFIPARRQLPKDHLVRAAKAAVASDAERYHLAAASAEALARIEDHTQRAALALGEIAEWLGRIANLLAEQRGAR